jgi:hypothetical protein
MCVTRVTRFVVVHMTKGTECGVGIFQKQNQCIASENA